MHEHGEPLVQRLQQLSNSAVRFSCYRHVPISRTPLSGGTMQQRSQTRTGMPVCVSELSPVPPPQERHTLRFSISSARQSCGETNSSREWLSDKTLTLRHTAAGNTSSTRANN